MACISPNVLKRISIVPLLFSILTLSSCGRQQPSLPILAPEAIRQIDLAFDIGSPVSEKVSSISLMQKNDKVLLLATTPSGKVAEHEIEYTEYESIIEGFGQMLSQLKPTTPALSSPVWQVKITMMNGEQIAIKKSGRLWVHQRSYQLAEPISPDEDPIGRLTTLGLEALKRDAHELPN
jgi:hypothetical protein